MQEETCVILCVDDDPDILAPLQIVLESGGYGVVTARTGKEGIREFRKAKFDAVILDLMMEEIDSGTVTLKEMKAHDPRVPIFMLSSTGDSLQEAVDTSEMGLAGVFQKPIDPKVLLGVLKAKLKRPGAVS